MCIYKQRRILLLCNSTEECIILTRLFLELTFLWRHKCRYHGFKSHDGIYHITPHLKGIGKPGK